MVTNICYKHTGNLRVVTNIYINHLTNGNYMINLNLERVDKAVLKLDSSPTDFYFFYNNCESYKEPQQS